MGMLTEGGKAVTMINKPPLGPPTAALLSAALSAGISPITSFSSLMSLPSPSIVTTHGLAIPMPSTAVAATNEVGAVDASVQDGLTNF